MRSVNNLADQHFRFFSRKKTQENYENYKIYELKKFYETQPFLALQYVPHEHPISNYLLQFT